MRQYSCPPYPACTALCRTVLSPVGCQALSHLSTLSHKWHNFLMNIKWVSWFSLERLSETTLIVRRIQRHYHQWTHALISRTRYSCQILITLELSRQIFGKSSDTKPRENRASGNRTQTYRRTDLTQLLNAYRNSANKTKQSPVNWALNTLHHRQMITLTWPRLLLTVGGIIVGKWKRCLV
jgi:hypothetical protein